MPIEDRRIIFTYGELYTALFGLCVKKEVKRPPPGAIKSVVKRDDDENQLVVSLFNEQEKWDRERAIEYSRDFVAAALMLLCRGHNIPMPKTAKKSVVLGTSTIILRVEIGEREDLVSEKAKTA